MDTFVVDELFDFSGDDHDFFSSSNKTDMINQDSSSTSSSDDSATHFNYSFNNNNNNININIGNGNTTDFNHHFCVPIEDEVELEWLSKFVDDSFTSFPANNITGTINYQPENRPSFHGRSRSKRARAPSHNNSWTSSSPMVPTTTHINSNNNKDTSSSSSETTYQNDDVRRCTHCASEKTPQWRTGPLGPKTLCNACGVRYKSGRLVPEYRPAASPTFVLTQHSNSHRKVMELRRQKETMMGYHQQLLSSEQQMYRHHGSNHGVNLLSDYPPENS